MPDSGDLTDMEQVQEGGPVPFEVGGRSFAIRQPLPVELDALRLQENIAYNQALAQPGMEDLAKMGVSDDALTMRAIQTEALRLALEEAADEPERRRQLSRQLSELEGPDTRTRAQEVAEAHSRRHRDRYAIERLIVDGDGKPLAEEVRAEFMANAQAIETARPAVWRVLQLAMAPPNWNGRQP